ncbi:MAG: cytochrome c3 family protein [Acidobacteriota bacterium]
MRALRLACLIGMAAAALAANLPAAQEKAPSLEDCAACHEEVTQAFAGTAHGAAMATRSPKVLASACAACHNPAPAHLEDPSAENVRRVPDPSACLTCHGDRLGSLALATPGHERTDVACSDCHQAGHMNPAPAEPLLAAQPRELCASCHQAEAAAFRLPYAHREGPGAMDCTACHDVHGLSARGRYVQGRDGGVCLDCHSEKSGPFVFPHPPQRLDACLSCHTPHGSANPRLLLRRQAADLCLECHTRVPSFHNLTRPRYRNCLNCHTAVHGSNRNPVLFDE